MRYFINESKRDDLLLGYYNSIVQSGINISFGQFKSKLLRTLASEGGIHNLSLRSNYYLAGAARYYFNGDLTENHPVALMNPKAWEENSTINDVWKEETCKYLDSCIKILRNAYIDSVGTTFEQPEDFGTLPIAKLLRKYGKLIRKDLGIVTKKEKSAEVDTLDRNDKVGNNYTFEIMYSYEDCQKYERPTSPGSWCITYGQQHYNYYVNRLKIHYVIFRMDGWENIKRPENPENEQGWSAEKPHDLYGNSLIALLQSNSSEEPVYITSRWNHGYGEYRCEADHAYTKEEFQQITGVTDDDLKRIYDIWQHDKPKSSRTSGSDGGQATKQEFKNAVMEIKYIQMRINGGENPEQFLQQKWCNETKVQHDIHGSSYIPWGQIKKSISVCKLKQDEVGNNTYLLDYSFLVDRGKIVFETISKNSYMTDCRAVGNFVFLEFEDYNYRSSICYVYNMKLHQLLKIDNVYKFISQPASSYTTSDATNFFTLNRSAREFVLIDFTTGTPLKLPNGQYWSNSIYTSSYDWRAQKGKRGSRWIDNNIVIRILYDESSGEQYFFHTGNKQFIKPQKGFGENSGEEQNGFKFDISANFGDFNETNYFSISKSVRENSFWHNEISVYKNNNGIIEPIVFNHTKFPTSVLYIGGDLFYVEFDRNNTFYIVTQDAHYLHDNGNIVKANASLIYSWFRPSDKYLKVPISVERNEHFDNVYTIYILNKATKTFIKNPVGFKNDNPLYFKTLNNSIVDGAYIYALVTPFGNTGSFSKIRIEDLENGTINKKTISSYIIQQ